MLNRIAGFLLLTISLVVAYTDGWIPATISLLLGGTMWFCWYRNLIHWNKSSIALRTYSLLIAVGATGLVTLFVFAMLTTPSLINRRVANSTIRNLKSQPEFASIRMNYEKSKIHYLNVTGAIKTKSEFESLRKFILDQKWKSLDRVYWDLYLTDEQLSIDEPEWVISE